MPDSSGPSTPLALGIKAWAQTDGLQWRAVTGEPLAPLAAFPPPPPAPYVDLRPMVDPKPANGAYTERAVTVDSLHALDDTVAALNEARISKLDLTLSLDAALHDAAPQRHYFSRLLSRLDARTLRQLSITHPLESADVPPLSDFLLSPAARGLEWLRLSSSFATADYDRLADGVRRNPSLTDLCLQRATCTRFPPCVCSRARDPGTTAGLAINRLYALLARNARYARRVRAAVRRVLPVARVVLTATRGEEGNACAFPLLELPHELVLEVVRHASGDARVLNDAQWSRVIAHAEDPRSAARVARGLAISAANGAGMRDARAEWFANGQFFWEHGGMKEEAEDAGRADSDDDDDADYGNGVVRSGAIFFGW
ncbi:uncharacterized protein LOC62_04G006426 [Vanrija pseudolonga]|uniref:Uncharacterized protein n=1 Tax=Vanrija pseudolonga TaxID=143232 RepID=A0AAF1BJ33_9TREE|nr:hypothetical protein LOC62_04G006426 [Vanrija pseudolonga]